MTIKTPVSLWCAMNNVKEDCGGGGCLDVNTAGGGWLDWIVDTHRWPYYTL